MLLNPHLFAIAVIENPNGYREHDIMHALNKNQLKNYLMEMFLLKKSDATCMSRYFSDKVKYGRKLTIKDILNF